MISFNLFYESETSDAYERSVATHLRRQGIDAERPSVGTEYSDIRVTHNGKTSWIEVKMNHSDNLANPRFFFDGKSWDTTYSTPIARYTVEVLNSSSQAKEFVKGLRTLTGNKNLILPTTLSGLRNENAVPLDTMIEYVSNRPMSRYILKQDNVDLSSLVSQHYIQGKAEPAYYLQAGDDFYKLSNNNPLKLPNNVPQFKGTGSLNVRVSTRSKFYEIQLEAKVNNMASSPYSIMPNTHKLNPFVS
jgi:hypothetical protein